MKKASPTRVEILAAMTSRSRPLIVRATNAFVPTWGTPIPMRMVTALEASGLITRGAGCHRIYVLTEAGRNVALNASDKKAIAA